MTIGQFVGMIGIIGVPFGIIWIVINKTKKQELFRPILFTILFLAPIISIVFLSNTFRNFSRNIAIKNGNKLVKQIEDYNKQNGYYPDYLDNATFDLPHSWIIGVKYYEYRKIENNFELAFNQNVLLNFNFEIVTYNNKNEQKAQGELKTLHTTSDKNWKYKIYD